VWGVRPLPITTPPNFWQVWVPPACEFNQSLILKNKVMAGKNATATAKSGMFKLANKAMNSNEEEELELLGTVREIVGAGGEIYPSNSNNLMNVNKRLMLTLEDSEGVKEVLLTSPEVNRRLRAKEVSLSEVMDYPIYLTLVKDKDKGTEEEKARIGVWQGKEVKGMSAKADDNPVAVKEVTVEQLEGYLRY